MVVKRTYSCDLCHDTIHEATDGIGIRWSAGNKIEHVFIASSEHHLCNRCIEGLQEMFGDIKRTTEMYRSLDEAEVAEVVTP